VKRQFDTEIIVLCMRWYARVPQWSAVFCGIGRRLFVGVVPCYAFQRAAGYRCAPGSNMVSIEEAKAQSFVGASSRQWPALLGK
jgi:hypothetical protein